MQTATRLFSERGIRCDEIEAISVKSRADARKLGPFVAGSGELVLWVDWSKEKASGKKTRPYFRHYPRRGPNRDIGQELRSDVEERETERTGDPVHNKARDATAEFLSKCVSEGRTLAWAYSEKRLSDLVFSGNLLAEVKDVRTEHVVDTPFGWSYRLDVALLGPKLDGEPALLGAVELERTHEFEFLKCCLCKTLGCPLVSMDIEDALPDQVDQPWCAARLLETTHTSDDGLRRNYVYLHNLLYPVYAKWDQIPRLKEEKHQFVIFVQKGRAENLAARLARLRSAAGLSEADLSIHKVRRNPNVASSTTMFENEGSIAGQEWRDYDPDMYVRVTCGRPNASGGALYLFHLAMARVLSAEFEALVGYKYMPRIFNADRENPLWNHSYSMTVGSGWQSATARLLPKRISEPVRPIIELLGRR